MLDLNDDDHVLIRLAAKLRATAPAIVCRSAWSEAANPFGRIETRRDGFLNVRDGAHKRNDDPSRADIKHRLDEHGIVPRHANYGRRIRSLGGHDVPLHRLKRQSVVLHIDPDVVELGTERLGDGRVGKANSRAETNFTAGQPFLQRQWVLQHGSLLD